MRLDATNKTSIDDFLMGRPSPGTYHVAINHAEEGESKVNRTPGLSVEFEVIAGTTDGQAGKKLASFLSSAGKDASATETCEKQLAKLAVCCGILNFGENKEVDWNEAIGREILIKIESQTYTKQATGEKKEGIGLAFCGFWPLDGGGDKSVAKVPRDPSTPGMQDLARSLAAKDGNASKAATPAAANAGPAATTSAAPKKDWKSLV